VLPGVEDFAPCSEAGAAEELPPVAGHSCPCAVEDSLDKVESLEAVRKVLQLGEEHDGHDKEEVLKVDTNGAEGHEVPNVVAVASNQEVGLPWMLRVKA